jgi:hypothetical protein
MKIVIKIIWIIIILAGASWFVPIIPTFVKDVSICIAAEGCPPDRTYMEMETLKEILNNE